MKNALFKIITLLAGLFLTVILLLLLIRNLQNLQSQSEFIKNELAARQTSLEKVRPTEQISREADSISTNLKSLRFFVNPQEELELITQLEGLANQRQLTQKLQLNVKNKKAAPGGAEVIPTSITISGDYLNALRYLQDLEKLEFQVNISRINITNLNTETEKKGIEMILSGETYSFKL